MTVVLQMLFFLLGTSCARSIDFDDPILPIVHTPVQFLMTRMLGNCTAIQNISPVTPDISVLKVSFVTNSDSVLYDLATAASSLLANPKFDMTKDLSICLHGWMEDRKHLLSLDLINALLEDGSVNVLSFVTGGLLASNYIIASANIPYIGAALGDFFLALKAGGFTKKIHMIGHSLGAHVAGFAGKKMIQEGSTCDRISGLDPAGPCFFNLPATARLTSTDCTFVDIIHTNAGVFGYDKNIGDMDFWPNSGSTQPLVYLLLFSHFRALDFYIESIRKPANFPATKCEDYEQFQDNNCPTPLVTARMGYGCTPGVGGNYYLRTKLQPPYGLGDPDNVSIFHSLAKMFTFPIFF